MGLQKYRADNSAAQTDESIHWFAQWMGGRSLSKIENCRINGFDGRRTVYVTGEADTYFSIPAACKIKGKTIRGYLTGDDSGLIFHYMDSHKAFLMGAAS